MASMRLPQLEYPSEPIHPHAMMQDNLQYPSASQYAQAYYPGASLQGHLHPPGAIPRAEQPVRKRPKYTRSKTGCLTCRGKKVKCDEAKPDCTRCQQGQRECKWPEGVPTRKKPTVKKETSNSESPSYETRPSTACSSVSDLSTPPTRNHTPPKQEPLDLGLPPMASRRHGDAMIHVPVAMKVEDTSRLHQLPPGRPNGYPVHANTHTHMISGPGMLDTSSQYPTHGSYHDNSVSNHHYASGQSLALPRLPAHHSSQSPRFEPPAQWNHPQMMQTMDPIQPYFSSAEERNLIHHYCDNALSLVMALPSENPVLAANLQLVLSRAPGSDTATDALRKALLGIAATHQSYLFSRNGAPRMAAEAMSMANGFRAQSKELLSIFLATSPGIQDDASLAASVAISLLDIFSGGYNWSTNLNMARALVSMRGGPAVLLARSSKLSSESSAGVSRARLFVEIISVYDIFGCLATGQIPTLLSPYTQSWWLECTSEEDTQSHVEKCFGISRTFLPLFVKVTALVSRSIYNRSVVVSDNLPPSETQEAETLYHELEDWPDPPGLPERIHAGNRIYKLTAQIVLLREVLHVSPDSDVVQQHAHTVLTLCLRCGQQGTSVDLNWPVIIAGSQVSGIERALVLDIFEHFRKQCCYEVDTSQHIVSQVWKRLDEKRPRADWRSVMQDQGLDVLIL